MKNNHIQLITLNVDDLSLIQPLWEKLNAYHSSLTRDFSRDFKHLSFEQRIQPLLKKTEWGKIRIDVALDLKSGNFIGYCLGSIDSNNEGEIDSLFVEESFRQKGVGKELFSNTLQWMKENNAQSIKIAVVEGNEAAMRFYNKFGFQCKYHIFFPVTLH